MIPCLPLHSLVEKSLIENYQNLLSAGEKWINCENDFSHLNAFTLDHWLERIYFERLEVKASLVEELLAKSENNWEAVLFQVMAKNFGLNINGDAFLSMAQSIDFSVVKKCAGDFLQLEALLFGQAGLLEKSLSVTYYKNLQDTYRYLKHKHQLENRQVIPPKYFRLRPENFPSIRLSQLAALYHQNAQLFNRVIKAGRAEAFHEIFTIGASEFWNSHYSFKKSHKKKRKILSSSFVDLVIINGIVPLKFVYAKSIGRAPEKELLEIMQGLKPEANSIVKKFNKLRKATVTNALQSQGILQLKHHYCDLNKCLQCEIGARLLHS